MVSKRRKDKYNPYILKDDNILIFKDCTGKMQMIKLDEKIFDLFNSFELEDKKIMNEYDRHIEHFNYNDELLYQKTVNSISSLEDNILNKILCDNIMKKLEELPLIQRRRIIMYYFENYTLQKIATLEGCSARAVKYSIDIAIKNLKKILNATSKVENK